MNTNNEQIFVTTAKGEQVTIDFDGNDSVEQLKAKIQVATGIPIAEQTPVFEGQLLANGRDVKEYNLQKEATINLVAPVKGGYYYTRTRNVYDCGGGYLVCSTF